MPISESLAKHLGTRDIIPAAGLIGGDWLTQPSDGRVFEVTNPSTGELLAVLPDMGVTESDARDMAAFLLALR